MSGLKTPPQRTAPSELAPIGLHQAQALAHPSRRGIADLLAAAPQGLTVTELSEGTGLHHNAVREHLRTMATAGIVASERDRPRGRGRPTERYTLVDDLAPRVAAHQELVRLLVGLVRTLNATEEQVEGFGRAHGEEFVGAEGRSAILAALAGLGFAPRETTSSERARAGELSLRLEHCPFREAVLAPGGELICSLHRGLLEGMVGRAASGARLTEFIPKDPRTAGCAATVTGIPETAGPGGQGPSGAG